MPYRFNQEFVDCCTLKVEVGTTGLDGGDGSKTVFRLEDIAGCVISAQCPEGAIVTIHLHGDAEMRTFIKALEFTVRKLRAVCEVTERPG